jgi:hypothetical protein
MAFGRTWLYHRDFIKGKIFETEEDVDNALATGWKDSPGKVDEYVPQVEEQAVDKSAVVPKKKRAPGRPSKKVKGGK